MKKMLNTLYITSPDRYLSLDGENVVVSAEGQEAGRLPLHNLDGIVTFGYAGASPALMGKCGEMGIDLCFMDRNGKFLCRTSGTASGNVLLTDKDDIPLLAAAGHRELQAGMCFSGADSTGWLMTGRRAFRFPVTSLRERYTTANGYWSGRHGIME